MFVGLVFDGQFYATPILQFMSFATDIIIKIDVIDIAVLFVVKSIAWRIIRRAYNNSWNRAKLNKLAVGISNFYINADNLLSKNPVVFVYQSG